MSLVFGASRNVSFNDDNHILKFLTESFENLPSSFFLIPKICYLVLSSALGRIYTSRSGSFIQKFTTRWQIIMVLLFYMKQILILVRTFFVELIYLSGDLRTINCHINLLGYYHLRWRSVPPVSASICRPYFPCFSRCTPPHFYSIAWVFLSLGKTSGPTRKAAGSEVLPQVVLCKVRSIFGASARRIRSSMNRFYTQQTKIFGPKICHI